MNSPHDSLTEVLHSWRVNPPAEGDFRAAVWQQIGSRAKETWSVYIRAHAAAWLVVATLTLGAAAYTGHSTARARAQADREALAVIYLVDLDPRVQATLKP